MDQYITITSEDQNPCSFISNFVESVNISDGYEVAVKSIFHAPLYNITNDNNQFALTTRRSGRDALATFEISVGFYESTCDIMGVIHKVLTDAVAGEAQLVTEDVVRTDPLIVVAPTLKINNGIISMTLPGNTKRNPENNLYFLIDNNLYGNSKLLRMLGYCSHKKLKVDTIVVPNYILENTCEAGFLYSSIVTNSKINQKQSRLLACLPINSKSGYNFYEVQNPVYQPLSVHSFTDINFALTNVYGEIMVMDRKAALPTILLLHIRKIR